MEIEITQKDGVILFGVLLFDSGKKIHLDEGELKEFQHKLKEAELGREIGTDGLKFTCPDCGTHRLECCEDGPYNSEILNIDEEGDFDYGEINADGQVERYQCLKCGFVLKSGEGFAAHTITENDEVVEWIKKR
jgi:predicted RNA-binding Zn-ribbon protein involved in translation (DUF1610 family)